MPKLRVLSGPAICAILIDHGFAPVRERGSHLIMQRRLATGDSVTVVVPNHREVDRRTLSGIIRQSGLPRALFTS